MYTGQKKLSNPAKGLLKAFPIRVRLRKQAGQPDDFQSISNTFNIESTPLEIIVYNQRLYWL